MHMKNINSTAYGFSFLQSILACILLISSFQSNCLSQTLFSKNSIQEPPFQITFRDFFNFPIGSKGMEFSKKVISLVGQKVVIDGYMVKSDSLHKGQFLLTPNPMEINEEDDGPANDLPVHTILVKLDEKQSDLLLAQRDGLLRIEGRLELGREEDEEGQVSWIRIRMFPQSIKIISAGNQAIRFLTIGS